MIAQALDEAPTTQKTRVCLKNRFGSTKYTLIKKFKKISNDTEIIRN